MTGVKDSTSEPEDGSLRHLGLGLGAWEGEYPSTVNTSGLGTDLEKASSSDRHLTAVAAGVPLFASRRGPAHELLTLRDLARAANNGRVWVPGPHDHPSGYG